MAPGEESERLLPPRHSEEVRDDEDERAAFDRTERGLHQLRERGSRRALEAWPALELVDQPQDLHAPAPCGHDLLDLLSVEDRPDPVAVPGENTRDDTDEI